MTSPSRALAPAAVALLAIAAACSGGKGATSTASSTSDDLSVAIATATSSAGTLLCTPSPDQLDACASLAAGDPCELTAPDGVTTVAGTCRTPLDGAGVACAPTPPAPPSALVDACSASTLGDACTVTEPDGDTHDGVCVTWKDGATLVCGRQAPPPPPSIDACAASTVGDTCTFANRDHQPVTGVCSLGPAETGPLGCALAQALRPSATYACAGRAAGDPCQIGGNHHGKVPGTCVTPANGGDPVCLAACADLGGRFRCGPRSGHDPRPPGSMDPHPVPSMGGPLP